MSEVTAPPGHGEGLKLTFKKPHGRPGRTLPNPALALSAAQTTDGRALPQQRLLPKRPGGAVRESPVSPPSQLPVSLNPSVLEFRRFFQELDILIEFKLVCHYLSAESIFVAPSLKTVKVWHGIIFLHNGPFRGGCFRFNIYIPDCFPEDRPTLKFSSHVFHPQVDRHGCLNLMQAFPEWRPRKDHIWHILKFMKQVFCSLDTWQPLNEKATIAVHESMDAFHAQAMTCVHESIQHLLEEAECPDDDGNVLKFFNLTEEDILEGQEAMLSGELPDFGNEHQDSFLGRVTQRVSELWESWSGQTSAVKQTSTRTGRSPRALVDKIKRKNRDRRPSSRTSSTSMS